jgi:hypothetical protein
MSQNSPQAFGGACGGEIFNLIVAQALYPTPTFTPRFLKFVIQAFGCT